MLELGHRGGGESDGHREPIGADQARASSNGSRRTGSSLAAAVAGLRPFVVEVERRANGVAVVQPHGELDLATVATLRAALDGIEHAGRLVVDLRGLSFIDAIGLNLLVALDRRAKRDGVQLTLVAPTAPANRALELMGLDRALPFVAARDALERDHPSSRAAAGPQPMMTRSVARGPRSVRRGLRR